MIIAHYIFIISFIFHLIIILKFEYHSNKFSLNNFLNKSYRRYALYNKLTKFRRNRKFWQLTFREVSWRYSFGSLLDFEEATLENDMFTESWN